METWFLIVSTLCISAILKAFYNLVFPSQEPGPKLPPGPPKFPIIGNLSWLRSYKSFPDLGPILRSVTTKFGPMVTLHIAYYPAIFVSDRSLAHQALVENGSVFADRSPAVKVGKTSIGSAAYGPTWRILRRNLTAEILNPSRIKSYSQVRTRVLQILKQQLIKSRNTGDPISVVDYFRHAMFCLFAHMCFGAHLDENQIRKVEVVQRDLLLNIHKFNALNFWPKVTRILLYKLWKESLQIKKNQADVFIPLIRARKKVTEGSLISKIKEDKERKEEDDYILSYVDTLLDLQLPEEKRKLDEGEIVTLCSEFLGAGTDPTSTALQWIMANLVKYPLVQEKLYMEIKGVVGEAAEEVKEDDLHRMPYLKAVILEGLRRHPPAHFLFHGVREDVIFNDFLVPRKGIIIFFIEEMGLDPKIWEDPLAFKPERFLRGEEEVDITGWKEIKMIPFGAGRRICPAHRLAMLHLGFFVANLVWFFEWKAKDGDDVDLSEKKELTFVMKNPLQACIYSRPRQV
ncbi:cytochrome P450 89A2-like [Herrania umbratica]|uniref:Cytochrome P450 89A2-like n=1 Tax=Herrania umbratica TaxID=108875 RepID=A0A6J1A8U0_9ROSI|nr:cytochrome P450 89A2-like [Herrania umbratica]